MSYGRREGARGPETGSRARVKHKFTGGGFKLKSHTLLMQAGTLGRMLPTFSR